MLRYRSLAVVLALSVTSSGLLAASASNVDSELEEAKPLYRDAKFSPGPHTLVLETDDRRHEEEVEVASGATVERDHRFPGFGSLSISSDVWVLVSVDGGPAQQTPVYIARVTSGRHTVRVVRFGYQEKLLEVEVREGQTAALTVTLERQK